MNQKINLLFQLCSWVLWHSFICFPDCECVLILLHFNFLPSLRVFPFHFFYTILELHGQDKDTAHQQYDRLVLTCPEFKSDRADALFRWVINPISKSLSTIRQNPSLFFNNNVVQLNQTPRTLSVIRGQRRSTRMVLVSAFWKDGTSCSCFLVGAWYVQCFLLFVGS